jgi:DNA-binding NarL/FixJ family response regulator
VLMTTPLLKLIDYIKDAYDGGAPMSPTVARQILNALVPVNNVQHWNSEGLTSREIDILRLLVKGHSYKLVSYDLKISIDTVRSHIKNIYSKLNVNSKSEAIIKVLKDRLIP